MDDTRAQGSLSCPIIVILGSTGTGKSKLAIELGERLNGEIISADSMQIYRGLDIITNKVTEDEKKRCTHHMIDLISPLESFNVVEFRNRALPIMADLTKAGKIPIIVGGTNYYIEALLWDILVDRKNIADYDSSSGQSRAETPSDYTSDVCNTSDENSLSRRDGTMSPVPISLQGENSLYEELKRVDPAMAMKLHPNNTRKISRSLEIYNEFGKRHSELLDEQKAKESADFLGGPLRFQNALVIWLTCDSDVLNERLSDRVDDMIGRGLVEEIRKFYDDYARCKATADSERELYTEGIFQSIGFKEFHPYLTSLKDDGTGGQDIFEDCVKKLKQVTCKYAKKQIAWVKNRFLSRPVGSAPDIYELSTTDAKQWKTAVLKPALEIARAFLSGSNIAYTALPRITKQHAHGRHQLHSCDICHGRLIMGDEAWDSHCKSRSHRKLKAKRRRLEQSDEH